MSSFQVKVHPIKISEHPNADALELGSVPGMDYQFIVAKGLYQDGDLGAYIPEQAVLPFRIIDEMGIGNYLAGPEKNRVKAQKLRGVLSQGIFYRPKTGIPAHWDEGLDVSEELGVVKYEPVIPAHLAGKIKRPPPGNPVTGSSIFRSYTDIENIKNYPDVLVPGEEVVITEKLHGTCHIMGIFYGERVISSKGVAQRGFQLEEEESNTYWRVAREFQLFEKLEAWMKEFDIQEAMLFGEAIGVQDLMYGLKPGQVSYRAFDLYTGKFAEYDAFCRFADKYAVPTVPLLYRGPFDRDILLQHTVGKTTLMSDNKHIREGVVVKPVPERCDEKTRLSRVVLKSISPDYLTRKGEATEFN